MKAADKHVKMKKVNQDTKCWLTSEIKTAIAKRNQLRITRGSNREEWQRASRETAELIKAEKQQLWKDYVESVDIKTKPGAIWKTIRSMDGRYPEDRSNEVLVVDGVALMEDKDKANQFAKTYKQFSKIPLGARFGIFFTNCWKLDEF